MKSRREYYETRKLLMICGLILYSAALFLLLLCFFVPGGFATIVVILSLFLLGGAMCGLYAHRSKEFLFCPKCGSKRIVTEGLFGIPAEIKEECPDCGCKLELDKPINKD